MDDDLRAMTQIKAALDGLDEKAIARVLGWATRWAADAYGISIRAEPSTNEGGGRISIGDRGHARDGAIESINSLFADANPLHEADKVLVVGYWLQKIQGHETLDAQQVNQELKHLGHVVKNITRTFSALMDQKPQLAVSIRKSGSTQQARKRYKLTMEGLRKVEEMLGASYETEP
jgi:hypothetical protein